MNYFEYINQLVKELRFRKAETLEMYNALVNAGDNLNPIEASDYLQRVNDCHVLANRAEQIMHCVLNGSICVFDPID
jgi:hypothetical protein